MEEKDSSRTLTTEGTKFGVKDLDDLRFRSPSRVGLGPDPFRQLPLGRTIRGDGIPWVWPALSFVCALCLRFFDILRMGRERLMLALADGVTKDSWTRGIRYFNAPTDAP